LRTPLAALHGYLETVLLKGEALGVNLRREYLEIAHRHSQQLERLIATLFELSKLETGAVTPTCESFSIADLLNDIALRFRLRAQQRGVELLTDLDHCHTTVHADIALVERVLENLLDNALHHTPPNGRVVLATHATPTHMLVSVSDTGSGVAPQDLPHVFDRFYRGSDRPRASGAGLGLAIARRIVELHGQKITLQSTLGAGTRIEFGLPLPEPTAISYPRTATAA